MLKDNQTNFLYLADTLPKNYPIFYSQFELVLKECKIHFDILPKTKDIWAVDYMPIQLTENKFLQFLYRPTYLIDTIKWSKTITDVDIVCKFLSISTNKTTIKVDGGNVIKSTNKVIMCDSVFKENPDIEYKDLIVQLKGLFEVDKIIFIPSDPYDKFGHADGVVRFYNDNTVLINEFNGKNKLKKEIDFHLGLRLSLHNAGLNIIEIPYNPYGNDKDLSAKGIYINYLEMRNVIIIPIYGMKEDDVVFKQFCSLFKDKIIATVDCNEIAKEGGVLNCITWNIFKN